MRTDLPPHPHGRGTTLQFLTLDTDLAANFTSDLTVPLNL